MNRDRRVVPLALLVSFVLPITVSAHDHRGSMASANEADRTIVLKPGSKYVNVEREEIVTLKYGDKLFTWKFDTLGTPTFALSEIAPREFGATQARVYVAPERDRGGG